MCFICLLRHHTRQQQAAGSVIHSNWKPAGFHLTLPGSFNTTTGHHISALHPYLDTLCIYKIAISQDEEVRQTPDYVCRLGMSAEMKRELHLAEKSFYIRISGAVVCPREILTYLSDFLRCSQLHCVSTCQTYHTGYITASHISVFIFILCG